MLLLRPFDVEPVEVACPAALAAESVVVVEVADAPAVLVSLVVVDVVLLVVVVVLVFEFDDVETTAPHDVSKNNAEMTIAICFMTEYFIILCVVFFSSQVLLVRRHYHAKPKLCLPIRLNVGEH